MTGSRVALSLALRILEWVLLAIGVASIGWLATAQMAASREQAALSRALDRTTTVTAASAAPAVQ